MLAARASFIAGCEGTSNVHAAKTFGIPVYGTTAHSWILVFDSEQEAFDRYHAIFPDATTLLVDTYDTIQGVRNATRFGKKLKGVRLDSGDLLALSREVRRILDETGLKETRILASGDLNEYKIHDLMQASAPIDLFGVGTEMVTSQDHSALSAVYKLVERQEQGKTIYCAKFSEDKETYPGRKQVWRFLDKQGVYLGDEISTAGDEPPGHASRLVIPVMERGELLCPLPPLEESGARFLEELAKLPERYRRLESAETYPVAWSESLKRRFKAMRSKTGSRPS